MKDLRRRRLKKTRELVNLLPTVELSFGGGHVVPDPAYIRDYAGEVVSPSTPEGKVIGNLSRRIAVYKAGLVFPLMALMNAPGCPRRLRVVAKIGAVGDEAEDRLAHARLRRTRAGSTQGLFQRLEAAQAIPAGIDCAVTVVRVHANEPLLGAADMFAGVSRHLQAGEQLGRDLYEAARPALDRVPWNPPADVLVPGITLSKSYPVSESFEREHPRPAVQSR